jgi:amino acid transporter
LGLLGTKAVNSLVFAEYLNRVLWNVTRGDDAPSEVIPVWVINTTAVVAVVFVFVLVVGTCALGPRATVILTSIKVKRFLFQSAVVNLNLRYQGPSIGTSKDFFLLLPQAYACAGKLSVIALGFIHKFLGHDESRGGYLEPVLDSPSESVAASYALALYAGLWSFDGFNQANYVAGEMRHPTRDIPRAIHLSMGLVTVRHYFPFVTNESLRLDILGLVLPRKCLILFRP